MERVHLRIHGIVQGVGFRPFIHKLVGSYGLTWYIKNTSSGVELELEGERAELERFVRDVPEKAPKLAVIESVEPEYSEELVGFSPPLTGVIAIRSSTAPTAARALPL